MKINKLGHCCLALEEKGVTILTDPGIYSTAQNDLTGIDIVLITHEHQDHYHIESLKTVLKNNPQAIIVTNKSVGALLEKEGIAHAIVGGGDYSEIKGIDIEGFGYEHALVYKAWKPVENTSFLVGEKFYFPGDAFNYPEKPVDILALPTDAPWMKVSEAVEFAQRIKPRTTFPVHDAMQTEGTNQFYDQMFSSFLAPENIAYVSLNPGETKEF